MSKIVKSDAEWKAQLSDLAYKVTRKHGTERAFTHDDFPKVPGTYHCVCCGAPLFDQADKFDSGTGLGPASPAPPRAPNWVNPRTASCGCAGPRCIAPGAMRIWAMSFPMVPPRPGCAIA